eukprot:TRINITY_DN23367_c0_g1_i1.p1 TRINITY_DN23367_c0_g1~~TRINITY_DN23367_c0_g1_i1.p1  ORF type:complete len:554 (-),score=74.56 TRINITY_DN23367_c0_g1_i1:181-1791(-)
MAVFACFGRRAFVDRWTQLDLLIVCCSTVELLMSFVGENVASLAILRMLRIVRVLRLAKLLKKISMFKELRKLLMMAASSVKTLCWAMLICFLLMTVWAMIAVEMVHPVIKELYEEGKFESCSWCGSSMSSVMRANLTLFQTVIASDSWGDLAVPVITAAPWTSIIFSGALITIVFGILNLVIAVVVDTFAEHRQKDLQALAEDLEDEMERDRATLKELFARIDYDGSGQVTLNELFRSAKSVPEFRSRLRVMDVDMQDLKQLFYMIDADKSGTVESDEFVNTLSRWLVESRTATRFVKYNVMRTMNEQFEMRKLMADLAVLQLQLHQKIDHMAVEAHPLRVGGRCAVVEGGNPVASISPDMSENMYDKSMRESIKATLAAESCAKVAANQLGTAVVNLPRMNSFDRKIVDAIVESSQRVDNEAVMYRTSQKYKNIRDSAINHAAQDHVKQIARLASGLEMGPNALSSITPSPVATSLAPQDSSSNGRHIENTSKQSVDDAKSVGNVEASADINGASSNNMGSIGALPFENRAVRV